MPNVTADRAGYVAALPTFAQSAELVGIHPSGIGRAVKRLGIAPIRWGKRDKHLSVVDLLTLAADAQRETTETVAARLLDHVALQHPDQIGAIRADIEAFFTGTIIGDTADPGMASESIPESVRASVPGQDVRPEERPEPVLRAPAEPDTARRLVALYTLHGTSERV